MNRSTGLLIVGVLVAIAAAIAAFQGSSTKDTDANPEATATPSATPSDTGSADIIDPSPESSLAPSPSASPAPSASVGTQAAAVSIQSFAFAPASITVKKGTTVTWTNADSVAHTVTVDTDTANGPDSPLFSQNGSYSFTFTVAGTYAYHCKPHPDMKGTVIVTD